MHWKGDRVALRPVGGDRMQVADKQQADREPRTWKATFFAIWAGQALSLVGSSLVQFALIWWLTESTSSGTVLATATLVGMLPGIFVGPFAGALVDRWNRRTVMMVADSIVALAAAGLAYLFIVDVAHIWHIYAIMLIRSIAGGFHWPAMQASTSLMVPEDQLSRVAGLNQTLHGVINILSPPLGALLLGILPLQGVLGIDIATAALAITSLAFTHVPQPQRQPAAPGANKAAPSLWADVREGLRYVWSWPGLRALLGMAAVLNFLINPAFSLMPLLVTNHFGGQAIQLGWLESSWGAGMVVGGLVLSIWGGFRRRVLTSLLGLVGMGLGILTVGLTPPPAFYLALGAMFVAGTMNPIVNGPLFAILQGVVLPEMQGRVFTVMQSVSSLMSPLSLLIAGPASDLVGVRTWYVVAGVACVVMGFGAFTMPTVVHLEDNHSGRTVGEMPPTVASAPAGGAE